MSTRGEKCLKKRQSDLVMSAEKTKAEMLRDAKAAFGDKKPEGNEHKISGLSGA